MGLRQSVGDLATTLMSIFRTRLELFALEASEQKARMLVMLVLVCGALLFSALAVVVFSIAIVLYYWPSEQRYVALFVLAALYALAGLILFFVVRYRLLQEATPFAATLEELRQDVALIDRLCETSNNQRSDASWKE